MKKECKLVKFFVILIEYIFIYKRFIYTMVKKIQSAWWIVYYIDKQDNQARFLLLKRYALSKKIEWVAPKGKIQNGELPEKAAVREVSEEVGLPIEKLQIKDKLDTISLQLFNDQGKLGIDKDITFFLVHYSGKPDDVQVADAEWYMGMYKRVTIQEALSLIQYRNLRELVRMAFGKLASISVKDKFIKGL